MIFVVFYFSIFFFELDFFRHSGDFFHPDFFHVIQIVSPEYMYIPGNYLEHSGKYLGARNVDGLGVFFRNCRDFP